MDSFLKILNTYKLKQEPRDLFNNYYDNKSQKNIKRHETVAEHIYSCLKLADYLLSNEKEFSRLNKLKVFDLIMYHDDIEIITGDIGILDFKNRKNKNKKEQEALKELKKIYPKNIFEKFHKLNTEYIKQQTPEAIFVKTLDKLDGHIQARLFPRKKDKIYDQEIIDMYTDIFKYSPTFIRIFKTILKTYKK